IVVKLLDVLAMVPFAVGESEESLFENRIAAVPECERQAQAALIVSPSGNPIFTPSIGAQVCVLEREVPPAIAVGAVVFSYRSPLPLRKMRAPEAPWRFHGARFV